MISLTKSMTAVYYDDIGHTTIINYSINTTYAILYTFIGGIIIGFTFIIVGVNRRAMRMTIEYLNIIDKLKANLNK